MSLLGLAAIASLALALPGTVSIAVAVPVALSRLLLGVMEWAKRG